MHIRDDVHARTLTEGHSGGGVTYRRGKGVAWRRVGGETVIVNLDRRRILALNETGGTLWQSFADSEGGGDGPATGVVVESGSASEVGDFLADLEREGVLERLDGVPSARGAAALVVAAGPPPAVVWREELNRFGGSCGLLPGGGMLCDSSPQNS